MVALQAWLGIICPLTTLEQWLRRQAGEGAYQGSFIQHWLQEVLFYEAPAWVFIVAYTVFALLVLLAWFKYPPQKHR